MRTISQRELRNNSGEIMRQVRGGVSFRVTSNGEEIAVLSPAERSVLDEMTIRRGTQNMEFPAGITVSESTEDVLRELRGDR
ncbi:type II toxin-antitoxin system Phd/YefM family antitoxin [Microbacterium luticocti]|uniref:type II toxin-antitoxin system Phd/YefM family antitoxin n=1 Tax=Microbacterium luticocti TaxID=451764 RepID=UPI0004206889|nr:type II toxin-antitoxin system prevent-host-death family antitoxin [Microbacterium luticocti]